MAEFFDQICRILSETAAKHPGDPAHDAVVEAFFSDPVMEKPVPVTVQETPVVPETPAAPAVQKTPAVPVVPVEPAVTRVPGGTSLQELAASLAECRNCPLCANRTNLVFGEGNPDARLMFVGEAPGYDEDQLGRPFVGKAGQLLDRMITAMQFSRQEVYIANIVKCRPQGNRNPMPEEISKCIPFLHRQIELVRPEVIVVLGSVAAKALLQTENGISRMRGRWCSYQNIPVMPTFHPAFLLRQESAKKDAWLDLQQVMARFGKFHKR